MQLLVLLLSPENGGHAKVCHEPHDDNDDDNRIKRVGGSFLDCSASVFVFRTYVDGTYDIHQYTYRNVAMADLCRRYNVAIE